jgi:hydroxyethylthiazole kinase
LGLVQPPSSPSEKAAYQVLLGSSVTQKKFERLICKFPSEWVKSGYDTRFSWLTAGATPILTEDANLKLRSHYEALAFWEDAAIPEIEIEHWYFPPATFIKDLRACSWLSLEEMAYMLPRYPVYDKVTSTLYNTHTSGNPAIYQISHTHAKQRLERYYVALNNMFNRYGITTISRKTHFFAQTITETAHWTKVYEIGRGAPNPNLPMAQYYAAFYGRGIMQLTWASNYESYGAYRSTRSLPSPSNNVYEETRITETSVHYWSDPTVRNAHGDIIAVTGIPKKWAPRFDPMIVENNVYTACDTGGFYWVSKNIGHHKLNINKICDKEFYVAQVHQVSRMVNGGGNGYMERQAYSKYIHRYLSDSVDELATEDVSTPKGHVTVNYSMSKPA